MILNYFIEKADREPQTGTTAASDKKQPQKIKVNNKTATGGWW